MSEQLANVESYIARLRKPCGVPPFVQREVADILEALLAKAKEADAAVPKTLSHAEKTALDAGFCTQSSHGERSDG